MEFLLEYGLFFSKVITLLIAVIVLVAVVAGFSQRNRQPESGHIEVISVNEAIDNLTRNLKHLVLNPEVRKQDQKKEKKRVKEERKLLKKTSGESGEEKSRVFVVNFVGDLQASAVSALREEVTAIMSVARKGKDEVVVRLESMGGTVHGYGLAASQLKRITSQEVSLTVAVDKVAASGGYMMACIGSRIIAAPFAILGSIGVVAQLPNFHRLLKNKDIDVELLTAGEYKRTLTMFGENTKKGREKFVDELEDIHSLFKNLIAENRPQVDVEKVATGETWYGIRALEHDLVDELMTSDEFISNKCTEANVFLVKYVVHKNKLEKIIERFTSILSKTFGIRSQLDVPLAQADSMDRFRI